MSQKIKTSVEIDGSLTASQIANATTDTDKFLVSDSGTVKYRTSAEILSDLGITLNTASKLQHQVKAGVAINKGQAVYVTSADGTNMIVGLASNASESTSSKTMGLLDATVSINGFANVVTEGLLAGLDTSTATVGNPVWLGTNGNLIYGLANKPSAPSHLVFIGIVTRVNANNGEIFVKVQNGFELDEIHDVDLKTTAKINGHLLGYNGSLWVNKTIAEWLGYTPYNASNPAGYISSYTETDPTVPSHVKSITTTNISNWNTAYGWGNHASAGYLTSYTETDTLASITGRGATTSTLSTFDGGLNIGNAKLRWGGTTSPTLGFPFTGGPNGFWIDVNDGDTGGLAIDNDGTTIYGAGDSGHVFRVIDEDVYQATSNVDASTTFRIQQGQNGGGYLRGNFEITGTLTASGYNKTNWDTAFGWGNHASAGYALANHTHIISPVAEASVSPNGISIQAGPGSSNPQGWSYPYGTKLSAISGAGRSFEIMSTTYPDGQLVLRTLGSGGVWDSWKTILDTSNYSTYVVPTSRTITINGTSYDLSDNRSWTVSGTDNTKWPLEGSWKPASLASSTRLRGATSPDGGEFALAYSGGQIHPYADGFFYQNEGAYRVIDTNSVGSYAPTLTGTGASGTWGISVTGNAATATNATQAGAISSSDTRTISPSSHSGYRATFGFTSWGNNNTSPWADYLHLRSYADGSGGNDNLVTFRKDAIGMRIWQQTYGSTTAYSSYKDIAFTDGTNSSGTWGINITGNAATVGGIETGRIVYGDGARASTSSGNMNDPNQKSGFHFAYGPTGAPYTEWWNWITVAGNSWQSSNNYEFQLAHDFHSDGFYVRRMTNGSIASWRKIVDSANYNDYAPTKTGGGASGTWGIGISGNAATATTLQTARTINGVSFDGSANITIVDNSNRWYDGWVSNPGYNANTIGDSKSGFTYSNNAPLNGALVHFGAGGYGLQLNSNYGSGVCQVSFRSRNGDAGSWGSWGTFLSNANYNSYAPTLTGGGASGTWGINITGNASSVNTVTNTTNADYYLTFADSNNGSPAGEFLYTGAGIKANPATGTITAANISLPQNPVGSTYGAGQGGPVYSISLPAGDNDGFRIYSESPGTNRVRAVFQIEDDIETESEQWVFRNKRTYSGLEATTSVSISGAGTLTAAQDIVAYSDKRVKENINTIDNALEKVKALRGVTYNRTDKEDKSEKIGVIAQEIQEVLPQVVHEQEDGMLGVSYGNIVAVLIEAIKEQQKQIEELKQLVQQLTQK